MALHRVPWKKLVSDAKYANYKIEIERPEFLTIIRL